MTNPPPDDPGTVDLTWREPAHATREALKLLGYKLTGDCFPGEANPCGGRFWEHTIAQLVTLRALIDHQLTHHCCQADVRAIWSTTYGRVTSELYDNCEEEKDHARNDETRD